MFTAILVWGAVSVLIPKAFANYDRTCLEALRAGDRADLVINEFRSRQSRELSISLRIQRSPSDLEIDAFVDLEHGLGFIGIFDDERRQVFTPDRRTIDEFALRLRRTRLTEVRYLRDSLNRLGPILKTACHVLSRRGCEVYDEYEGLSTGPARPLTRRQEFLIRQATIALTPPDSEVEHFKRLTAGERALRLERYEESRMLDAYRLLTSTFVYRDAESLLVALVVPYISMHFGQFATKVEGRLY